MTLVGTISPIAEKELQRFLTAELDSLPRTT